MQVVAYHMLLATAKTFYFRLFNSGHFLRILLFLGRDFSYEDLLKALELLVDFEKKANARVIDSGVLKGINIEDIKKAGECIILQDGCTSFFQNVMQKENVNVHVLSYSWCGDLIRSKFAAGKPIFLSNVCQFRILCFQESGPLFCHSWLNLLHIIHVLPV